MTTPLKPLWQALATAIHQLGINDPDKEFPRVLLDQFEQRPKAIVKGAKDFETTFLIDVVTKNDSPIESLDILELVQGAITVENIKVEGFIIQSLEPEALTPIQEVENGIWRQLQRYRIKLT